MDVQRRRLSRKRLTAFLAALALLTACDTWHDKENGPYGSNQITRPNADSAVSVTFMGTTTLLFRDETHSILIDGFFSRPGKFKVLFGKISPDLCRIRGALSRSGITKLEALLVAHSHYDHAMDAATVASITGASLYGSESTRKIAEGGGLSSNRIHNFDAEHSFGRFKVRTFASLHSPEARYEGEISAPLRPPAPARSYKEGGSYSFLIEHGGHKYLVHPSANYVAGMYSDVEADVVFLSIGALSLQSESFLDSYWNEVVVATNALLVVPIHWDDFTIPLDRPLRPMPSALDDVTESMARLSELAGANVKIAYPHEFIPFDPCQAVSCGADAGTVDAIRGEATSLTGPQ